MQGNIYYHTNTITDNRELTNQNMPQRQLFLEIDNDIDPSWY